MQDSYFEARSAHTLPCHDAEPTCTTGDKPTSDSNFSMAISSFGSLKPPWPRSSDHLEISLSDYLKRVGVRPLSKSCNLNHILSTKRRARLDTKLLPNVKALASTTAMRIEVDDARWNCPIQTAVRPSFLMLNSQLRKLYSVLLGPGAIWLWKGTLSSLQLHLSPARSLRQKAE